MLAGGIAGSLAATAAVVGCIFPSFDGFTGNDPNSGASSSSGGGGEPGGGTPGGGTPGGGTPGGGTSDAGDGGATVVPDPFACDAGFGSDPANCGYCGHACGGTTLCQQGMCTPTTVTTSLTSPTAFAVDIGFVYAAVSPGGNQAVVKRISRDLSSTLNITSMTGCNNGTARVTAISVTPGVIQVLGVGPDGAYNCMGVLQMLSTSNPSTSLGYSVVGGTPIASAPQPASGKVGFTLGSGAVNVGAVPIATNQHLPSGVAIDGTYVYWTSQMDGTIYRANYDIMPYTISTVAQGQTQPGHMAMDGADVYWANVDGRIMHALATGGAASPVFQDEVGIGEGLALDADYLYWTNQASGTVNRVSRRGGPKAIIARAQTNPSQISVDGSYIYWANGSGAGANALTLYRVAK